MKTLKEMIAFQDLTHEEDIEIIQRWFIENDREQDGLTLIPALAKSQVDKVKHKYDCALAWVPMVADSKHLMGIKDKEVADNLYRLEMYCALDYPMRGDNSLLIWAQENIHNKMAVPKCFFMPTVDYLKKYGVEFIKQE